MNAIRPLRFLIGAALLGLGATLVVRAVRNGEPEPGESNSEASVPYGEGARIERVVVVERPAGDLYAYWRDLERLPTIMSHLERVEQRTDGRSRWTARGPGNVVAVWEAELVDDTPGERIAWRSVGGSVPNAGSVTFTEVPGAEATELRIEMEWIPPGGRLGRSLAEFFGGDPGAIVERDLRRFKSAMEASAARAG
ncbi:MAG: SRPBCC family protein [Candidatus Eremiobacteraeota bacterium]|nr:SRPBCC family protein [Candidatus Eremiobacteraeota bacterium]